MLETNVCISFLCSLGSWKCSISFLQNPPCFFLIYFHTRRMWFLHSLWMSWYLAALSRNMSPLFSHPTVYLRLSSVSVPSVYAWNTSGFLNPCVMLPIILWSLWSLFFCTALAVDIFPRFPFQSICLILFLFKILANRLLFSFSSFTHSSKQYVSASLLYTIAYHFFLWT